jgi:hypothetical protein
MNMVLKKKDLLKYKDLKIHISTPHYLGMRFLKIQFEIVIYTPYVWVHYGSKIEHL